MTNLTLEQKDRIKFEKSKAAYKAADSNMMKKLNQITKKRSQLENKSLAAYKKGNREAGKKFQQQADKFTEEYNKVRKQGIKDKRFAKKIPIKKGPKVKKVKPETLKKKKVLPIRNVISAGADTIGTVSGTALRTIPDMVTKGVEKSLKRVKKSMNKLRDRNIKRLDKEKYRGPENITELKFKTGGKIQYRSIGGKVLDGNDIIKKIYD